MINELFKGLNIDPMILGLNIVLFVVFFKIMDFVFWRPMMKHIGERQSKIQGAYQMVDDTRREMERLKAEYRGRLNEIESDARGRILETVKEAQERREQLISDARNQAETLINATRAEIVEDRKSAIASLTGSMDKMASVALERATGSPTEEDQGRIIKQYMQEHALRS